jgi:hypothetical protein
MSAQLALAPRCWAINILGYAHIAHIAYKLNLVAKT